jgi:outer membrane protein assembly factor BamA
LLNWRNFFVGGGQKLLVKSEFGYNRQDIVVSFTEPYFMYEKLRGRKVAFGLDFFARNNRALGPDIRIGRIGGDIRLGTPVNFAWIPRLGKYIGTIRADLTVIGEYVNVSIDKSLDYDDFVLGEDTYWRTRRRVNPKNGRVHKFRYPINFERYDKYLKDDDGSYVQAAPEFTFTRDTRDNLILPTRGSKSLIKAKISLGTTSYGLMEAKHSHYFKLFDLYKRKPTYMFSGSHVLLVRGSIGYATYDTPIFDRFFLGGTEEMRGFRYGMAGPKDYSEDNPLGGTTKLFGSLEYVFPIYKYSENISVHGSLWFDAGNVWWKTRKYHIARPYGNNTYYIEEVTRSNAGEINGSLGGSVIMKLWRVPFRINYGYPLIRDSESKDVDPFDGFSFGTGFSF